MSIGIAEFDVPVSAAVINVGQVPVTLRIEVVNDPPQDIRRGVFVEIQVVARAVASIVVPVFGDQWTARLGVFVAVGVELT